MDKAYIDFILMYRDNIRKAINEKKEDMNTHKVGGDGSGHCKISDPTAETAIRNITPMGIVEVYYGPKINGLQDFRTVYDSERWLRVADETWKYYRKNKNQRYYQIMLYAYGSGLKGRNLENVAREKLHIGRRRCYYMLMSIRNYAYKLGKGLGLRGADERRYYDRADDILKKFKESGK